MWDEGRAGCRLRLRLRLREQGQEATRSAGVWGNRPGGTAEQGAGSILTARGTHRPVLREGLTAPKLLLSPRRGSHGFSLRCE